MKPIFIAASPNSQKDDVLLAIKTLLNPFSWFDQKEVEKFEKKLEDYFDNKASAITFDSARSAFYLILKSYGIGKGDEVILPSFSCLVVANPVIWNNATPVYVDIDPKTLNIDLNDLKNKITSKTKAVLVQHTFGLPVDIDKVREIVGLDVKIIEDAAHSLGSELKGKKVGLVGDAAIFTFGIEKVISTIRGGMALTQDRELAKKLKDVQSTLPGFSIKRLIISLLNPILWFIITPVYYTGIGKLTFGRIFTWILHRLNMLGIMIEGCEYKTYKPKWLPSSMPGALAKLGINQLRKLDKLNEHRTKIADIYSKNLGVKYKLPDNSKQIFLRFPVKVNNPKKLIKEAKKRRIVLGDWYKKILYAPEKSLKDLGYRRGETPVAEKVAREIVNLPTGINVSFKDAYRIIELVKEICKDIE